MLYRIHLTWTGFELTTIVVIGTDCKYSRWLLIQLDSITTMTAPYNKELNNIWKGIVFIFQIQNMYMDLYNLLREYMNAGCFSKTNCAIVLNFAVSTFPPPHGDLIRFVAILFPPSFAPNHLMFIVTGDTCSYYRNALCALNLISTFLLHQLSFQLSYCKNVPDFSPTGGVYVGVERYLRQNWVQWRNWSLKNNPHSYIPSANYINPYTYFVFEIWKLYPFILTPPSTMFQLHCISWRSVFWVEESGENYRPVASLINFIT
jgi:hypothetical protein